MSCLRFAAVPAVACLLLIACSAPPDQVDRSFSVTGDVIGATEPQTFTIRVRGLTPHSPYRVELRIADAQGRELHREESRGDDFDQYFGQDWLVKDCAGYEACKDKWYFRDIPRLVETSFVSAEHPLLASEQAFYEQMDSIASRDLIRMGYAGPRLTAVLKEMRDILGKPGFRLVAPISRPMGDHGDAKLWVPSIHRFVSCYDP
jgi:hypothetical protein